MSQGFPLSAIVGQDALIDALLVNAVAPDVGGVLVRGERGTAKSTAVRALAPLLPPVTAAAGEPFAFAPGELGPKGLVAGEPELRAATLVELPLGASLDRLVGALDLGRALAGERAFEPGCSPARTRGSSTWTRSTCCPTTSSTRCSTPRRRACRGWSARRCRSCTRRASCWWGR